MFLQDDQANYKYLIWKDGWDKNVAAEIETLKIEFERHFVIGGWKK